MAVVGPHSVEPTDLVEVDEMRGPHETKVEERNETLPAGQDLGLPTVLAEQGECFVERRWRQIVEPGWLHALTPWMPGAAAAPPAPGRRRLWVGRGRTRRAHSCATTAAWSRRWRSCPRRASRSLPSDPRWVPRRRADGSARGAAR